MIFFKCTICAEKKWENSGKMFKIVKIFVTKYLHADTYILEDAVKSTLTKKKFDNLSYSLTYKHTRVHNRNWQLYRHSIIFNIFFLSLYINYVRVSSLSGE